MPILADIFALASVGSLLALTRHEVGPFLIHRPLVAGPVAGALVGLADVGFLLGACLEWIWIDRIPAGGIRTPAATIGLIAGLILLAVFRDTLGPQTATYSFMLPGLLMASLYVLLFVPVDGGLRRLWNLTGEGVVSALQRDSLIELRFYAPTILFLRWFFVMTGLLSAGALAWVISTRTNIPARLQFDSVWPWIIPAAFAGFLLRRRKKTETIIAGCCFIFGMLLT